MTAADINAGTSGDAAPARPRPRRWVRITVLSVVGVLVLAMVAMVGIGYYFSSVLLVADNTIDYPLQVKAVNGNHVTLSRDPYSARPVILGLWWDGGDALLSSDVQVNGDSVVRTITATLHGTLTAGIHAAVDTRVYDGDPSTDRQLTFTSVHVDSELGPLPAWYVPPTADTVSSTWIIALHGRRGTMTEPLRVLPTLAASGHPTLVTSYRNDPDRPRSPDGYYHLGDTEWRDVQAAIEYAHSHGATSVVLYGWSMGGTLTLTALRRMPTADVALVHAVILDSPAIDWTSVLDLQGGQRGLPLVETRVAERIAEVRDHMSLANLDARPYAPKLAVPTLIFVDTADTTVPVAPTLQFAAAAPSGLVTLVKTTGGDHTGSWNVDPSTYDAHVTDFLSRVN
jgi:pimeloyl-ACP methyl ester carboxylesterase